MRAVVYEAPGTLRVADRPKPVPTAGEVLIRVAWFGICGSDLLLWSGGFARVTPPVTVGHEFSGVVEDANGASDLRAGDRVVVEPLLNCGECTTCRNGDYNVCERLRVIGIDSDGAGTTFVVVPANRVHRVPDGVTLRDAALVEPTAVAVHMSRRVGVQPADQVFIAGAGPIGVIAALVSRAIGASRIVLSEISADRRAQADALGFQTVDPLTPGALDALAGAFDIGFELTGVAAGLTSVVRSLRPRGRLLLGGIPHEPIVTPIADAVIKELTLVGSRVYQSSDFVEAIRLIEEGKVVPASLVTRTVPIEEAIENAYVLVRDSPSDLKILIEPVDSSAEAAAPSGG